MKNEPNEVTKPLTVMLSLTILPPCPPRNPSRSGTPKTGRLIVTGYGCCGSLQQYGCHLYRHPEVCSFGLQ